MKIIFATGNEGKMREIRQILGDMDAEILSMKEAGIRTDIVEDGSTFEENAIIKAKTVAAQTDAVVLADDSGLEIDYLNKEPGIYSARYLGEDTPYSMKNQKILDRLAGVPDEKRTARFVCAIAAVLQDGEVLTSHGVVEGRIMGEVRGKNGFGYDPIFYSNDLGCGMAEVPEEEKNKISHRGRALEAMRRQLERK
jgi:XTP/dITP diphosphohydrolase